MNYDHHCVSAFWYYQYCLNRLYPKLVELAVTENRHETRRLLIACEMVKYLKSYNRLIAMEEWKELARSWEARRNK